jgi:hypothetical protein
MSLKNKIAWHRAELARLMALCGPEEDPTDE